MSFNSLDHMLQESIQERHFQSSVFGSTQRIEQKFWPMTRVFWDYNAKLASSFLGSRLTPSIVSYVFDDGKEEPAEILVGSAAKRRQIQDFTNTIYGCFFFLFKFKSLSQQLQVQVQCLHMKILLRSKAPAFGQFLGSNSFRSGIQNSDFRVRAGAYRRSLTLSFSYEENAKI